MLTGATSFIGESFINKFEDYKFIKYSRNKNGRVNDTYTGDSHEGLMKIIQDNLIDTCLHIANFKDENQNYETKRESQFLQNIKSYGIGDHRHIAEINQELSIASGHPINVFFSANLIPVNRGILSNIYLTIDANKQNEIYDCLEKSFVNENFISLLPLNEVPATREVIGSNRVSIGVKRGYKDDLLCIVSVIDNLLKGAAGQAMQNFNLMNEFNETTALTNNANIL